MKKHCQGNATKCFYFTFMMHSNIFQINSVLNAFKNPKNPKCITVSTKIFSSTTVLDMSKNKTEIFLNTNQYVSMISEGSCDTDDWSI